MVPLAWAAAHFAQTAHDAAAAVAAGAAATLTACVADVDAAMLTAAG
jgi:hypothetical protein